MIFLRVRFISKIVIDFQGVCDTGFELTVIIIRGGTVFTGGQYQFTPAL